jgi:integrase
MKMPAASIKLTKRSVEAAQPGAKDYVIWDSDLPNFGLRVYASGQKSYGIQYRFHGRSRRYTIGPHGPVTAEDARKQATILLGRVARGDDPAEEKKAIHSDPTIAEVCEAYLKDGPMLRPNKKESTWVTDRRGIRRHIIPLLGSRKLAALTRKDVQRFQVDITNGKTARMEKTKKFGKAIVRGGPGIAARTTALLRLVLNYAVECGLRTDNPARNIVLNKTRKCERFLSGEELVRLGIALNAEEFKRESKLSVSAIRLLLLTGCRKSEILTLQWRFLDWDNGLLRLPDSKTGARLVPLGHPALDILRALPRIDKEPYVFPSPRKGEHLVGLQKVWMRVRKAAQLDDVRLHDLRHSFASMAVAGGTSLFMVGKILGHKDSRTTEIYAHIGSDPLKIAANDAAQKVARLLYGPPLLAAE